MVILANFNLIFGQLMLFQKSKMSNELIEFNKTYIDQNGKEQTLSDEKILPKI